MSASLSSELKGKYGVRMLANFKTSKGKCNCICISDAGRMARAGRGLLSSKSFRARNVSGLSA